MFQPVSQRQVRAFVFAGGGVLRFSPRTTWVFFPPLANNVPNNVQVNLNAAKQSELAVLYGFGMDYKLPWRFALRLQYRGLLYREPDFKVDQNVGKFGELLYRRQGTHGRAVDRVCVPLLTEPGPDFADQHDVPRTLPGRDAQDCPRLRRLYDRGSPGFTDQCVADLKS